jgi:hypothetical protein
MYMSDRIAPLASRPAWKALQQHAETIRPQQLRDLFKSDPERGVRFTAEAGGMFLDYSKNRITDETLKLLMNLAEPSPGCKQRLEAMFTRPQDQHHGEPRRAARRFRAPKSESLDHRRRRRRRSRRARVLDKMSPPSPNAFAAASGRATPASAFATSSTSASAARTSVR